MALAQLHIKATSPKSISVIPENLVTINFEEVGWKCIMPFMPIMKYHILGLSFQQKQVFLKS